MPKRASAKFARRLPIGAEVLPGRGTHFRVWAPKAACVSVLHASESVLNGAAREVPLSAEEEGYFSGLVESARAGMFYKFKIGSGLFPDPASRFQPEGPHGASEIIDGSSFAWTDQSWRGVQRNGQVIYELHTGTFTPEGTWRAAMQQLPELAELGITLIEVMPVAEFPGKFGWGYDGVDLFAPTRLYGRPEDFKAFINEAHRLGVGIILDVVYNHFGPDGNYLKNFSDNYFTHRYANEWGEAINFDGENSRPVREFFAVNAEYWTEEFHLDGLRLDATQQIFDASAENILSLIASRVRKAARGRGTYIVAENEPQDVKLVRAAAEGGYGLDALWNDDFHHSAMVALTSRCEAYYSDYRGNPQELISAAKYGYLYQGQWYSWQKKRRGSCALNLEPEAFVSFLQNHDQVANTLRGLRAHQMTSPGCFKALTALLLLGPATPMLFQGQEFAASSPFLYFADHNPELAKLVASGRREFLSQFKSIACPENDPYLADPGAAETFQRCKLNFEERERHREIYLLHRDLLRLRRTDPVFSKPRRGGVDGAVLGPAAFVLRFFGGSAGDRLLLVNLGAYLNLSPAPEPLLAASGPSDWEVLWSSEAPWYGGCGTPPLETDNNWRLVGQAALVLTERSG
jgi:maltooligosyltrehalose trehalohydrolase